MINPVYFYFIYVLLFPERAINTKLRFSNKSASETIISEKLIQNKDEYEFLRLNFKLKEGLNKLKYNNSTIWIVKVKPDSALKMVSPNINGHTFDDIRRENKWVKFLMNAGMFHPNYQPVGLLINKGKLFNSLDSSIIPKYGNFYMYPNGVFFMTKSYKANVLITDMYKSFHENNKDIILATQSGPMLVYSGQIHSGFSPNSPNKNIRNGVGVNKTGDILFAISQDPISFYDLALIFRDILDCPNALYLDGTISELYFDNFKKEPTSVNKLEARKFGPVFMLQEK